MDENTRNFFWGTDLTCLGLAIAELAKQTNTSIDEWHSRLVEQALNRIDSLEETEDGRKAAWQNGGKAAWQKTVLVHQKRYIPDAQSNPTPPVKQVGFARYLNSTDSIQK